VNVESVVGWLARVGVPPEVVSVGAEADNAWCLLRTERLEREQPGNDHATSAPPGEEPAQTLVVAWEVFWREQGNRYDWACFTNEQVACHYLFGRLAWSQVARGAVGLLPQAADPA
jgi:hypothetical protein